MIALAVAGKSAAMSGVRTFVTYPEMEPAADLRSGGSALALPAPEAEWASLGNGGNVAYQSLVVGTISFD
jgi:hypothetical protein